MNLLALLVGCALILNVSAYVRSMPSILFYISTPFWLLAGVHAKSLGTGAWWTDIYFYLFILFSVGLTFLSVFEGVSIKKVDVQLEREADEAEHAGDHEEQEFPEYKSRRAKRK